MMLGYWQVFGLSDIWCSSGINYCERGELRSGVTWPGHPCLFTNASRTVLIQCVRMAFVSDYRCGTVLDLHQIPCCHTSPEVNQYVEAATLYCVVG